VLSVRVRGGTQEYYYEALRYMRRMLDDNVLPSRHTFHALLEGAKKHGDLARARWMLVKMVTAGGEVSPTEKTLALVLQTYASYRPEERGAARKKRMATKQVDGDAATTRPRPSPDLTTAQDPTTLPSSTFDSADVAPSLTDHSSSSSSSSTQAVIEMLGEASLAYPGPLPQTAAETVTEARNLMLQVVDVSVLSPPSSSSDVVDAPTPQRDPSIPSMFTSVEPSTFLLNSYLSVLNSHAPLPSSLSFFNSAYSLLSLPKNRHTFAITMRRLEISQGSDRHKEKAAKEAEGVWEEWLRWKDEEYVEGGVGVGGGEVRDERREREAWKKERTDGRNTSKMWGGLIRCLARCVFPLLSPSSHHY
jgi:hypothetical protein